jgi:hypothetical protein
MNAIEKGCGKLRLLSLGPEAHVLATRMKFLALR